MNIRAILIIVGILLFAVLAFLLKGREDSLLDQSIQLAGENRRELEEVLAHYKNDPSAKEKLSAAEFLIMGMPGMVSYDSAPLLPFKSVIQRSREVADTLEATGRPWWTEMRFQYYDSMTSVVDEWKSETNITGPGPHTIDLQTVTSDYLIRNIDLAFETRERCPWTKAISDFDFNEYVLPYAFGQGTLDDWRPRLSQKYREYLEPDACSNPDSLKQAINRILFSMGHMHYTVSLSPYIEFLPAEQILYGKGCTCSAKAKVNIQVLRSLGIPITTDFYQFPANQSAAPHQWNVIVNGDSSWSFDPYWQDLDEPWINGDGKEFIHNDKFRTFQTLRISKVFRTMYSIQDDLLEMLTEKNGDVPDYFRNLKMIDVSEKYLDVADVAVEVDPDSKYAYVCNLTLNHEWKPVFWSKVSDTGQANFTDLGKDVAYMVTTFRNGRHTAQTEPFILHKDGTIQWTTASGDTTTLVLDRLRYKHDEDDKEKNTTLTDFGDKNFELFQWAGQQWASLGKQELSGEKLVFHGVPGNGMYLLTNAECEGKERIFTYEEGVVSWW